MVNQAGAVSTSLHDASAASHCMYRSSSRGDESDCGMVGIKISSTVPDANINVEASVSLVAGECGSVFASLVVAIVRRLARRKFSMKRDMRIGPMLENTLRLTGPDVSRMLALTEW